MVEHWRWMSTSLLLVVCHEAIVVWTWWVICQHDFLLEDLVREQLLRSLLLSLRWCSMLLESRCSAAIKASLAMTEWQILQVGHRLGALVALRLHQSGRLLFHRRSPVTQLFSKMVLILAPRWRVRTRCGLFLLRNVGSCQSMAVLFRWHYVVSLISLLSVFSIATLFHQRMLLPWICCRGC